MIAHPNTFDINDAIRCVNDVIQENEGLIQRASRFLFCKVCGERVLTDDIVFAHADGNYSDLDIYKSG